ncbi:DUF2442 domain-containing protein [candidate division KSB1 bacterium]|nr:DUF2442 domain-containing protein [candidate division KSB1 bacterium]
MPKFPKRIEVRPLGHYQLWLKYADGSASVVDLAGLAGHGAFARWNEYREFQKVFIGPFGEIAWNEQVELCPDSINLRTTDKKLEERFAQC